MNAYLRRIPRAPTAEEVGALSDLPAGNPAGDTTNRSKAMDAMERRFARFGAMVVRAGWLPDKDDGGGGFGPVYVGTLDQTAKDCGLMDPEEDAYEPLGGVAEAAARLAAPAPSDAEELLADMRQKLAALAQALGLKVEMPGGEE